MNITLNIERLIECREKKGITKMEAAKRMNLSQPAYVRYENGDRTPSIQTLKVIANTLDTSVEYLTNKTDDPSPNFYVISKEDNADLFRFIEIYNKNDNKKEFMKRILHYAKEISKKIIITI